MRAQKHLVLFMIVLVECHQIYIHPALQGLLNLQNVKGRAKPYQVKQLLQMIEHHNLKMEDEL